MFKRSINDGCTLASAHGPCRVTDYRSAGCHAFGYHRAHAHHGAPANDQRLARLALLQDGTRANVSMVFNHDIAVAVHARRKGDEIAHHAVVFDITVEIGVEVLANAYIAGQRD